MPAKSQSQRGLVFGKRNQYGSKAKTPDKWKWVWDEDWENKGKLPKKKNKNETVQNVIMEKYRAKTVNEMFEEDVYGDPYVSDTTTPKSRVPKGSRMKDPTQVEEGDKSIDYNGERGTVIDLFMKDNDPDLFDEIVSDWGDDPDNYEDDTYLINVKGPEYGHFGGPGDVWFVYGREGAYVEEGVNEGMDSYNDRRNSSDNWPSPEKWTFQEGDMVEFDLRGMAEEFSDEDEEEGRIAAAHHGEEAEIISQSTFSEIGNQDYEYYSIRFNNGDVLDAVSGYHLFT